MPNNTIDLSVFFTAKALDVFVQLFLYVFFISKVYNPNIHPIFYNELIDASPIFLLIIGAYQLLSYFIHLFRYKKGISIRFGRWIYLVLIIITCFIYAHDFRNSHFELRDILLPYLHLVALYYLVICSIETIIKHNRSKKYELKK